jgi:phage repressor protein C with HTH and peptisase S24 domain
VTTKENAYNLTVADPLPPSLPGLGAELGSPNLTQVGARITQARGDTPRDEFAAQLDVHINTLGRYERGERLPETEFLVALANKRDISAHWVLYGIPPQHLSDAAAPDVARVRGDFWKTYSAGLASHLRQPSVAYTVDGDFVLLPHYDVRAAAGHGALVEDEPSAKRWAFQRQWLAHEVRVPVQRLALIDIAGDSHPDLDDGDVVLIDRGDVERFREGTFVFQVDGALFIKKFALRDGRLRMVTRSGDQDIDTLLATPDLRIIARVIGRPRFDRL